MERVGYNPEEVWREKLERLLETLEVVETPVLQQLHHQILAAIADGEADEARELIEQYQEVGKKVRPNKLDGVRRHKSDIALLVRAAQLQCKNGDTKLYEKSLLKAGDCAWELGDDEILALIEEALLAVNQSRLQRGV